MGTNNPEYLESLMEDAYTAYFAKDVAGLRQLCERGINTPGISAENEAPFRKLYAFALNGLSLQENQDKASLRQRAVAEAKKAIALYGDSADPIQLSEAYQIYGSASYLYSIALSNTIQKNQSLNDAISGFERAIELNPNNSDARKHLQSAKKIMNVASEDEAQNRKSGGTGCMLLILMVALLTLLFVFFLFN